MNLKISAIYKETVEQLRNVYDDREAANIAGIIFEDLLKIDRMKRLTQADVSISQQQADVLQRAIERLLKGEPVQHVTGETLFYDRVFRVNKNVLIPRPETEELIYLIKSENHLPGLKALDVGTGSGCIAITLALELQQAEVHAIDISKPALEVAMLNAKANQANVSFSIADALNDPFPVSELDVLVSNPPYIGRKEMEEMESNVLDFEPALALFVSDEDPLIFYRVIAEKGLNALNPGGKLYFEINRAYGVETQSLLEKLGYEEVKVFKDMQNNDRMVRAIKGN